MNELHTFTFNLFSEQTYLLDHRDGTATVFDPGMGSVDERNHFESFCDKLGVTIVNCLLTHAHLDHVMGVAWISERYGVNPRLHPTDKITWVQAPISAKLYGASMDVLPPLGEDLGNQGSILNCGAFKLELRCTPGHSAGHVVFVNHEFEFVIGGDVLFSRSIGRTDLPGGDADTLCKSIEEQLYTLPDTFTVHPGHGPPTTIGEEKLSNPYVNADGSGLLQR